MRTETKEIKVTKTEVVFVADDGVIFNNEEECEKYEESAKFAISKQIMGKSLIRLPNGYKEQTTGAIYFGLGDVIGGICSEDYDFYLFCPKTDEDIKLFLQYAKLTLDERCLKCSDKRTKESVVSLTDRLLIDDSDKWESWKMWTEFEDIEKGKTYLFYYYDGWGHVLETEKAKAVYADVMDTIVKQFGK